MILFVTFFIALVATALAAAYARHIYHGIVISRFSLFVVFAGALIVINEATHILLTGSVDSLTFILIGIGLFAEAYGANMMTKEARA